MQFAVVIFGTSASMSHDRLQEVRRIVTAFKGTVTTVSAPGGLEQNVHRYSSTDFLWLAALWGLAQSDSQTISTTALESRLAIPWKPLRRLLDSWRAADYLEIGKSRLRGGALRGGSEPQAYSLTALGRCCVEDYVWSLCFPRRINIAGVRQERVHMLANQLRTRVGACIGPPTVRRPVPYKAIDLTLVGMGILHLCHTNITIGDVSQFAKAQRGMVGLLHAHTTLRNSIRIEPRNAKKDLVRFELTPRGQQAANNHLAALFT